MKGDEMKAVLVDNEIDDCYYGPLSQDDAEKLAARSRKTTSDGREVTATIIETASVPLDRRLIPVDSV